MTKEDIKRGKIVYYARILKPVGTYEVNELLIRTVDDDYFVGIDKHDKHASMPTDRKENAKTVSCENAKQKTMHQK